VADYWVKIPHSILRSPDLSDRAVRVWGLLQAHLNSRGQAWPKINTLAEQSGNSPRNIIRALRELLDAGLITRESRHGTTSVYCINSSHGRLKPRAAQATGGVGVEPRAACPPEPRAAHRTRTKELEPITRTNPAPPSEDAVRLSELLALRIRERHPFDRPNGVQSRKWAKDVDVLLRRIKRDIPDAGPEDVEAVIEYATADDRAGFCWQANMRSGGALRKHFDRIADEILRKERNAVPGKEVETILGPRKAY